jgi:hypothetical protein
LENFSVIAYNKSKKNKDYEKEFAIKPLYGFFQLLTYFTKTWCVASEFYVYPITDLNNSISANENKIYGLKSQYIHKKFLLIPILSKTGISFGKLQSLSLDL